MKKVRFEEDYIFFEKIRRKKKVYKSFERIFTREDKELLESQVFGSIHTIDDSKIFGFHENDNYREIKIRPGVVSISPSAETNFETEWIPMSTKIQNRNPEEIVLLRKYKDNVREDSVILLRYRGWYKFKTLSARKGRLSAEKQEELRKKLNKLKSEENN
ncbi:MAG: hypothetical protein ACPL25_11570 [Ignavibacteria bacterium]